MPYKMEANTHLSLVSLKIRFCHLLTSLLARRFVRVEFRISNICYCFLQEAGAVEKIKNGYLKMVIENLTGINR